MFRTRLVGAALALCLAAGSASAQTTAAPVATPAAPAAMPAPAGKMAKPRTAQSIACSGQADQQGLHGKPRKTFMSKCKHGKG